MDMNSPEAQRLLQDIKLGIDALRFLESDLGGALADRCIADRESALEELAEVDPFNSSEICRLQMAVKVPTLMMQYINDTAQSGAQAEQELVGPPE